MKLSALLLVVAVGCAKSEDNTKPSQAADPPPAAAPTGADPWGAGSAAADPPAAAPSAGTDPWAEGSSAAASDPWSAPAGASVDPARPASPTQPARPAQQPPSTPAAPGAASPLAGSYDCNVLSAGSRSGRYQTEYQPSVMGKFQIADNGTYSSSSFPGKGSGRISIDAGTVTFAGGPYAGYIGLIGSVSSGTTIRFGGVQTQPPTPSVHFNDHVCYRK